MTRPAWFNVALFTISQRPLWMLGISVVVVLAWWNLADFYVVQRFPNWPEEMEPGIVILLSGVLVTVLVLVTRCQILGRLGVFRCRGPHLPLPNDLQVRRAMLTVIAENGDGIARRYVLWLRDSGFRWPPWVPFLLFLGLLCILAIPPLHSGVMESVSALMRIIPGSLVGVQADRLRAPDEIFNVRNVVTYEVMESDSAVLSETEYRLTPKDGQWVRTKDSIVAAVGGAPTKLRFFSGDFPHVHRHVNVECLPGCNIRGMSASSSVRLPVRAGVAEFEYKQPRINEALPVKPLKVRAWLDTPWGFKMFSLLIEPK